MIEKRPETSGVCVPFDLLTHETCDVPPMQIEKPGGAPGMAKQSLPPCPAPPTTSLPWKKAIPRGLSSPVVTVVTVGAAPTGIGSRAATDAIASTQNRWRFLRPIATPPNLRPGPGPLARNSRPRD